MAILLKYKGIDVNQECKRGVNPLLIACTRGNISIVNLLLACKDIDLSQNDEQWYSSLSSAVNGGHVKVVQMLLDKGVDVNAIGEAGITALQLAVQKGNSDIVKALLAYEKINVNVQTTNHTTPLKFAAGKGDIDSMNILLNHKAIDVNMGSKSDNGETVLYIDNILIINCITNCIANNLYHQYALLFGITDWLIDYKIKRHATS